MSSATAPIESQMLSLKELTAKSWRSNEELADTETPKISKPQSISTVED